MDSSALGAEGSALAQTVEATTFPARRLQEIYLPLILSWLRRIPGIGNEADDLAQEVLVVLFRELPSFERRRDGAFRAWLRQITLNRIRTFHKARRRRGFPTGADTTEDLLAQLEDSSSDLARKWDRDHDRHVFDKLMTLVKPDFEPDTWKAFIHFALYGWPAARVAKELGTSESAVMQSKYRILKRLREVAGDLLD